MTAAALRLGIAEFDGPTRWRWQLLEADSGVQVGDHQVSLDDGDDHYKAVMALGRRSWRRKADIADLGDWMGATVLGPVAEAIRDPAWTVVKVELPAEAEALLSFPLELARVQGERLGKSASFIYELGGGAAGGPYALGDGVRLLAIFCEDSKAKDSTLHVEHRVLDGVVASVRDQGVFPRMIERSRLFDPWRAGLRDKLQQAAGWDIVHISGYKLHEGLALPGPKRRRDRVSLADLVELLRPTRDRLKLVTLLARGPRSSGDAPFPDAARRLAKELDCAVLAVRYPVDEPFANRFVAEFYRLLLDKGQTVPAALRLAIGNIESGVANGGSQSPLLEVSPAVYGSRAVDLVIAPPEDHNAMADDFNLVNVAKMAEFEDRPAEEWRPAAQAFQQAREALARPSDRPGVLFHGPANCGKTTSALELAYQNEDEFSRLAWHRVTPDDTGGDYAVNELARALDQQLKLRMSEAADPIAYLPTVKAMLRKYRHLVVLDGLDALLTDKGKWRSERWKSVVEALVTHGGPSRVVITCRVVPKGLEDHLRCVDLTGGQ